jgi:putative Ca2+/H+ antiporter (TMEM165/GDT1 family)
MNASPLIAIFITVFLAELGDKTQLATILFSTERAQSPVLVFLVASAALVASTALAVLLGTYAARSLDTVPLKVVAGAGFIIVGGGMILDHFRA